MGRRIPEGSGVPRTSFCRRPTLGADIGGNEAQFLSSLRTLPSFLAAVALGGCEFGSAVPVDTCDPPPLCGANADVPDPLYTCHHAHDAYDCLILDLTEAAGEPDPMIFKAQVGLESNFTVYAVSPDHPCRIPAGWTVDEAKSFGLMQLTPACGWLKGARLADDHPNLERDPSAELWATSVFNPTVNIGDGVQAIMIDRASVMTDFPGCSEADYTKMALATFNRGSGVTGCNQMTGPAADYVSNVMTNYAALARSAHWPNRYMP